VGPLREGTAVRFTGGGPPPGPAPQAGEAAAARTPAKAPSP